MLLECGLPMSKKTGVPKDGILAHVASTFAEDIETEIIMKALVIC